MANSTSLLACSSRKNQGESSTMEVSSNGFLRGLVVWGILCLQISAVPQSPVGGKSDDRRCGAQDSENSRSCAALDGTPRWRWDPASASHPCNVRRLSRTELFRLYGTEGVPNLYPLPLVIYPDVEDGGEEDRRRKFANLTARDHLPSNFPPEFPVTLTGSDSLSSHRRTIPLTQHLKEVWEAGETPPDRLGNETWYLFGETFSEEWSTFLRHYDPLPPCVSCTPRYREQNLIALSFGVGNTGSGVQWHLHGPGFSETVHGRKHWVLYPPGERPEYNLDYASRHWMEGTYPDLEDWTDSDMQEERRWHKEYLHQRGKEGGGPRRLIKTPSRRKPWECTIHAGEMVYFPDQWHHATINLDRYTVFVSSFTTEHRGEGRADA